MNMNLYPTTFSKYVVVGRNGNRATCQGKLERKGLAFAQEQLAHLWTGARRI